MKKIFLFLIIFSSLVLAQEDYNNYDYLTLNFSLDFGFKFENSGKNPELDFVVANLSFFPKTEFEYEVLDDNYNTEPEINVKKDNETVSFLWVSPQRS